MQGVVIRIFADVSVLESSRHDSPDAEAELRTRLKAHGGRLRRRHASVLSFLVAEQTSVTSSV
jgi:hypothetical protein